VGSCNLQSLVLSKLREPIRESPELEASLPELIRSVSSHSLEGLLAKRATAAMNRASEPGPGTRCEGTEGRNS
jgi:hypothetical protein